jgi:integrase
MAGCRPLTNYEIRSLRRALRRFSPRDRALVTTQLLTGFRISEVLSLTVGSVFRNGQLVSKIGVAPRDMKGGYGTTRWVPMLPSLARALEEQLGWLRKRYELTPDLPLFLSRQDNPDGTARSVNRESARQIIHRAFRLAGIEDDGRLGTHTLRKSFALNVYEASGKDLMVLKKALNHSSVSVTQRYLDVSEASVLAAIAKCDRSRRKAPVGASAKPTTLPSPLPVPEPAVTVPEPRAATKPVAPLPVIVPVPTPATPAPTGQLDFFSDLAA